MQKPKYIKVFSIVALAFCFIFLLVYQGIPYLISQITYLDNSMPQLEFIYRHFPRHFTNKAAKLSLDEKQPWYIINRTIAALTKVYNQEELQQFEPHFINCLKDERWQIRRTGVLLYSRGNMPVSPEVLVLLENIFYNKSENRETRIFTGQTILSKCYKNKTKALSLVETYNNLDPEGKFGLVFEFTDKKNDYDSFIKLNGIIYKGENP